jgi:DNA-binding LytR/AlgR family response regulator
MEARLDFRRFVRIHRSHVVNLDFVAAIEPHEGSRVAAVLKSGGRIVASRSGTARLRALTSQRRLHRSEHCSRWHPPCLIAGVARLRA